MKKPIHLYILATLSGIASLLGVWGAFFSKFDEEAVRASYASLQGTGVNVDELVNAMRASIEFSTNGINKALTILLLALIIVTIVFLFQKKNETASYTYIGYLFGTLIAATYGYIGAKGVGAMYTEELLRKTTEATALGAYILRIVLFAIFFGLTVFFLVRKPKEKPSMEQTATDI
ncbi:MFS transporter [Streptococcus cuniculi]|uniref:MFS transporter n=1 Tax=Streptococcus cuniculi TaxID=1432788 RepID=A0A1Q8E6P6_9STRE|nr:MFS transporter [Streptococcus cuniculi]OLF47472.1 MFS transporter [Streptococcus cuniculi]